MSRRVPEAAILVGVVLSLSFAAYGALFGDPLPTALVSTLLLYAFVGYAVAVDDNPAATLLPDPVLAVATVAGGLAVASGLATFRPFLGMLVGLVLAVPVALFHAAHAESVNPLSPDATLAAGAAAGVVVLLAGVALGLATDDRSGTVSLAALDAGLLVLGAAEYHTRRGGRLPRRIEGAIVLATLGIAALGLGYFVFVAQSPLAGLSVAVVALVVGADFALVDERAVAPSGARVAAPRDRSRRRRRRGGGDWF
jgi:hypothetical protein